MGIINHPQDIPRDAAVIIIGAGPVGLCLAMELGRRNIPTVVLERRAPFHLPEPKCNHVASRTMEIFRSFGIAREVRDAGLPPDYPHDVVYTTSLTGFEIGRVRIPPSKLRFQDQGYADGGWPTPEPPHRINQIYLEPILLRQAATYPSVSICPNFEADTVEQHGGFVRVSGTHLQSSTTKTLEGRYLVGCDGTRSMIRKAINATFEGDDGLLAATMFTVRSTDILQRSPYHRAWMHWIVNPLRLGNIISLNGKDLWVVNVYRPVSQSENEIDFEQALKIILGEETKFIIESRSAYIGRRLLSTKFASGDMFIAGDAAHNWLPLAGYAMNAGIADAVNLGWKLAAVVEGWATASLLSAYEKERRPILDQVSKQLAEVSVNQRHALPAEMLDMTPTGRDTRETIGRMMMDTDSAQFACKGINFGYYYDSSPVICYDDEVAPGYSLSSYEPSTVPGCRLPHLWLSDISLYDKLGSGFTLIRCDKSTEISSLVSASKGAGVPLDVVDVGPLPESIPYRHRLVLARGDQHIVWRGDAAPADPKMVVNRIRGAG